MDMTTYYAIRNTNAKGIYTIKEEFQRKLKERPECSHRIFKKEQDALNWIGVKPKEKPTHQPTKPVTQNPLIKIIERYKQQGVGILKLSLLNRETIYITLKESYYHPLRNFQQDIDNKRIIDWEGYNEMFVKQMYDKKYLKVFVPTKVEVVDSQFVTLYGYDNDAPKKVRKSAQIRECEFQHRVEMGTINVGMIVSIKTIGHWGLEGYAIYDQQVLKTIIH